MSGYPTPGGVVRVGEHVGGIAAGRASWHVQGNSVGSMRNLGRQIGPNGPTAKTERLTTGRERVQSVLPRDLWPLAMFLPLPCAPRPGADTPRGHRRGARPRRAHADPGLDRPGGGMGSRPAGGRYIPLLVRAFGAVSSLSPTRTPGTSTRIGSSYRTGSIPSSFGGTGTRGAPRHPELLFLGRLDPRNGLDTVLAAMPRLLHHLPGARLTVAGDGPLRPSTSVWPGRSASASPSSAG